LFFLHKEELNSRSLFGEKNDWLHYSYDCTFELTTIADYDMIIVLDKERVAEKGSSLRSSLIQGSLFYSMVKKAQENKRRISFIIFARETNKSKQTEKTIQLNELGE